MVFKIIKGGSDRLMSCSMLYYAISNLKLFVPYKTVKIHKSQALSNSCLKMRYLD